MQQFAAKMSKSATVYFKGFTLNSVFIRNKNERTSHHNLFLTIYVQPWK